MPRRLRNAVGGYVYHVLNRAVGRDRLFKTQGDDTAFETVFRENLGLESTFQPWGRPHKAGAAAM